MAVETRKSLAIANRDASPRALTGAYVAGANTKHMRGVVAAVNADSIASKYLFGTIPSNAMPISVRVSCPDIGTTTVMDLGLYRTTQEGGAVVDADFFASALSVSGGALAKNENVFESGVNTIANAEKRIWEILGLAADPGIEYDVVGTLTGAADAGGAILVEIDYTT